jgi:hypothetical protein
MKQSRFTHESVVRLPESLNRMRSHLLIAILSVLPIAAAAHPPPGTDPSSREHEWWECQRQADNPHQPCCSLTDGHVLSDRQWKVSENHYQVELEGRWFTVPDSAVIGTSKTCGAEPDADDRQTAKVWYAPNRAYDGSIMAVTWYCFLPGDVY